MKAAIRRWVSLYWQTLGVVELEGHSNPYRPHDLVGDCYFDPAPPAIRWGGHVQSAYHFCTEEAALKKAIELAESRLEALDFQRKKVGERLEEMKDRLFKKEKWDEAPRRR